METDQPPAVLLRAFDRIGAVVTRAPAVTLLALAVVTGVLGWFASSLQVDNDHRNFFIQAAVIIFAVLFVAK